MKRVARLLEEVAMVAGEAAVGTVGGESLLSTIGIAVMPIAKVFTMCLLGFLMASKYVNILPANGRRMLNGVRASFINFPVRFFFYLASVQFLDDFCLIVCFFGIAAGLFALAPLSDILATWASNHLAENDGVVGVLTLFSHYFCFLIKNERLSGIMVFCLTVRSSSPGGLFP